MKFIDAYNYVGECYNEGYLDEETLNELMKLDWREFIKEVEKIMDMADHYAEGEK